jgi:hypothetical protein
MATMETFREAYYWMVEQKKKIKRKILGPNSETISGIYFDIEEGISMEAAAYLELVKLGKHLKPDKFYSRKMWLEACFYGRVEMVRLGYENYKMQREKKQSHVDFWERVANQAMIEVLRCPTPNVEIIKILVEQLGADPNYHDKKTADTPATIICRKEPHDSPSTLSKKIAICEYFLQSKRVNFLYTSPGHYKNAYEEAINSNFWRMACILNEQFDKDCFRVMQFLRKNEYEHESNWVALSLLANTCMTNNSFVNRLENTLSSCSTSSDSKFCSEMIFNETDLVKLITLAMWDAAKRGMVPVNRFTLQFDQHLGKTLRSISLEEAIHFMRSRCSILLLKYIDFVVVMGGETFIDTDKGAHEPLGGDYRWSELYPVIQDLYVNMWCSSRPHDGGYGEHENWEIKTPTQIQETFMSPPSAIQKLGPLPHGWTLTMDPGSGATYYVHELKKETSISRPKANVRKLQRSSRYVVDPKIRPRKDGKDEEEEKSEKQKAENGDTSKREVVGEEKAEGVDKAAEDEECKTLDKISK